MGITFYGTDHARPDPRAPGSYAVVWLDDGDPRHVGWSNENARAMFALLGVDPADSDGSLVGEIPLAEARRAVIRGLATVERRGRNLERPERVTFRLPQRSPDGTWELRPVRTWTPAFERAGMRQRLERLGVLIEALAEGGATHLAWA